MVIIRRVDPKKNGYGGKVFSYPFKQKIAGKTNKPFYE